MQPPRRPDDQTLNAGSRLQLLPTGNVGERNGKLCVYIQCPFPESDEERITFIALIPIVGIRCAIQP